ncbi:MAG: putative molybdenum carrier protein [Chromatiales bacterium]|nr:MAG: putative molybdenum carrier protein [Chromatiales bacterium]
MGEGRIRLQTVVSGGQTGVDIAALRAARDAGLAIGGWCPPDRCNEAGPIPEDFALRATPAERSPAATHVPRSMRTEWNVRDADATLLLLPASADTTDPGTWWTAQCAETYGRPLLQLDPVAPDSASALLDWLAAGAFRTLNVAGPRESTAPGIESRVYDCLLSAFRRAVTDA